MNRRHIEMQLAQWGVYVMESKRNQQWTLYRSTDQTRVASVWVDYEGELSFQIDLHPTNDPEFYEDVLHVLTAATRTWETGG